MRNGFEFHYPFLKYQLMHYFYIQIFTTLFETKKNQNFVSMSEFNSLAKLLQYIGSSCPSNK